ncbi:alkane 1-monooxygenase [Nonlabens ulvanivorans]|uniref:alkane 1-monooxygenase n=1 Tax=Nonlabens ulvanivorans TaxID=906888 RepID=UPI002943E019|nr:alkane 1-monooxygenase [Nonlabens ulvanivorans]WOI22370.1 alkane 1-monooxygenase [Nonlabens ulvanivorans]
MKDLKYLTAYIVPILCVIGIYYRGSALYITPLMVFTIVPLIELIMPSLTSNLDAESKESKLKNKLFDILLWLNVPIIFSVLIYGLYMYSISYFETYEVIGLIFTLGIVAGSNGINVAHELGHRQESWERFLGKILLLPSLYMHFYIEHNYGHHVNAATPEDPASARYNESLYAFWWRSVINQYKNSWSIQNRLLKVNDQSFYSVKNDMLWYTVIQLSYLIIIGLSFSWMTSIIALCIAVVGFSLLEIINYLEHYGLRRVQKKSGRYEVVREIHSWNSNHALGRILLYELTRHSDHHYRANKKYQLLDYHENSPQLPYGYPTMMVIATIPPLWFSIVNKHVPQEMIELSENKNRHL